MNKLDIVVYHDNRFGGLITYADTHRWRVNKAEADYDIRDLNGVGWLSNEFETLQEAVNAVVEVMEDIL